MGCEFSSPAATARKVLQRYDLNHIPIDVESLCKSLGIKIQYIDFSPIERQVQKKISGAIQKKGEKYIILVNDTESDARIRFTIAHELGHYFLHVKDDPRKIVVSFRKDQSPKETEANKFAAALLMPKEQLQKEYSKMVIPVSDTLAKKFKVSKSAMRNRLDSLGWMYV